MANTYVRLYFQLVLAVQDRESLIRPDWEQALYQYMTGLVEKNKHMVIVINGMENHLHLLIRFHASQSLADLIRKLKDESSDWVNAQRFGPGHFAWQEGYGAFSYGRNQVNQVYNHITNQKKHHAKLSFLEEYTVLLETFGIPYDKQYVFKDIR